MYKTIRAASQPPSCRSIVGRLLTREAAVDLDVVIHADDRAFVNSLISILLDGDLVIAWLQLNLDRSRLLQHGSVDGHLRALGIAFNLDPSFALRRSILAEQLPYASADDLDIVGAPSHHEARRITGGLA